MREPGYEVLFEALVEADRAGIGAPTLAEAGLVLANRLGREPGPLLERFLQKFGLVVVPFGEDHWREAVRAYLRFGKGRHPAALNFGDCMTYATAKLADQPLLYIGKDFSRTDLKR